jgi:alkylated DNA repair protein (DNA oxidative demethylase)
MRRIKIKPLSSLVRSLFTRSALPLILQGRFDQFRGMTRIPIGGSSGAALFPGKLDRQAQIALLEAVFAAAERAPFYTPLMPRTGAPMSLRQTNLGALGWYTDKAGGYRYQAAHPVTGAAWPAIPEALRDLWDDLSDYVAPPESCLVNHYQGEARMGLHVDADEAARDAPVISVSLGDSALFRLGGATRKGPTQTLTLRSGDVMMLAGAARHFYHGVDRIMPGSSQLVPGGGRINLTLRRVTIPH